MLRCFSFIWPSGAERYSHLVVKTQRTKHLLATCYVHCGQHYRAADLLQRERSPDCRYLLALCYMKLPGKLNEAAAALMPGGDRSKAGISSSCSLSAL